MKKRYTYWIVLIILLLVTVSLSGSRLAKAQSGFPPESWQTYEDPTFGYSVSYPPDWEARWMFDKQTDIEYVIQRRIAFFSSQGAEIDVDVWHNQDHIAVQQWIERYRDYLIVDVANDPVIVSQKIDGLDSPRFYQPPGEHYPGVYATYFTDGEFVFRVAYSTFDNGKSLDLYEDVLLTFQPIEKKRSLTITPSLPKYDKSQLLHPMGDTSCYGYTNFRTDRWSCQYTGSAGNCTWWAAYKRPDLGVCIQGNGGDWDNNAYLCGYSVASEPQVGDIAVLEAGEQYAGSVGHVAYVETVNADQSKFYVSHMNWGDPPVWMSHRWFDTTAKTSFIHINHSLSIPGTLNFESVAEHGAWMVWDSRDSTTERDGEIIQNGISSVSGKVKGDSTEEWNEGLHYYWGNFSANQSYRISFDVKSLGGGDQHSPYVLVKSPSGCAEKGSYNLDVGTGDSVNRSVTVALDNCNDYYLVFGEKYAGEYLVDNLSVEVATPNVPPNPPILQSPANASYHNSRTVTLSWQDGGDPDNQPRDYRDYVVEVWKSGWNTESGWILPTSWNVTVPDDGVYSWHVKAGDGAVGGDWSETRTFRVDTVPPTKASNVRPDGWTGPYTGNTTPAFAWNTASDDDSGIAGYYVAVDDWTPEGSYGNDWWVDNVTAYTVPSALPEGEHIFAVTSKDNAGNVNPTNTNVKGDAPYYTFYVDIAPPSTPQLTVSGSGCSGIQNNGWQNSCNAPAFGWSASDGNGSGVKDYRYYWGASANGAPVTITTTTAFAPGAIAPVDGYASMYLNVTARDQLDHESGRASFGVRYDGTTPTVTLRINDDAATTNQVSVWLNLAAGDTGSGVSEMRFSANNLTWSDWEPYAETKSWTLPALNRRTHTVYVQVRDRAGNESSVASDGIALDLYPPMPHSASYRICDDVVNVGGTVGLTSTSYALVSSIGQPWATGATANGSDSFGERAGFLSAITGCRPISHTVTSNYTITQWVVASGGNLRGSASYRLGDTAGQPAASGHSAFTSTSYTLSSGFWAQITGTVPPTSTIGPTPVPPTPTPVPTPGPTPTPQPGGFGVSINDGALYTNDANVTVSAWAPNVTQMRLNNDGAYADEGWTTYQITQTWVLSTYGEYVMPRTVYAWFKDEQSTVYGSYLDDIIYDPIPPQGNVTILGSTATTMTLGLEAQDDNSGMAQMRVGETTLANATWQPYTSTITWTLPSSTVYAQFNDRAGNESPLYGSDGGEHWLASGPVSVTLDGPTLGLTGTAYTFAADVLPVTVTLPITYIWQATGHEPITRAHTMRGSDVFSFTWDVTGTQTITVTALNGLGTATGTRTITILGATPSCPRPLTDIGIRGFYQGATLYMDTLYAFQAVITPTDATPLITYTWASSPEYGQGTPYASYQWSTPDTYTITLAAQNCGGIPLGAQHVVTIQNRQYYIYLPLVLRN